MSFVNYQGAKQPPTLRRNIEQLKHCVNEAASVMAAHEDLRHAIADLEQAELLLHNVLPRLREAATPQAQLRRGDI